jgi:hypothetical protein
VKAGMHAPALPPPTPQPPPLPAANAVPVILSAANAAVDAIIADTRIAVAILVFITIHFLLDKYKDRGDRIQLLGFCAAILLPSHVCNFHMYVD